jgi:hypothetical protein
MPPQRRSSPQVRRRRGRALAALAAGVVAAAAFAVARSARAGDGSEVPTFFLFLGVPDVTVIDLPDVLEHGAAGGIRAYSLGTTACNEGETPLNWCNDTGPDGCGAGTTAADHPVIAQNLYRLRGGRFEQIGMSWLKHGFFSTNASDPECGSCAEPPLGGDQLGVGCIDVYSASLNGSRPLGMRSEVDAATGEFPYPYTEVGAADETAQRIRVAESDLDPALNPGARYWLEGHYVARDDAAAGRAFNNASHREVTVEPGTFELHFAGATVRELPAIAAWPLADPDVELAAVDVRGSWPAERFHVARKATPAAGGWHYEYAVHNLDSARAANRFTVRFKGAAAISNPGFHAVAHHSGEPYATTPWVADLSTPGEVTWSTDDFAADPDANALRWGTVFSFWFDATAGPEGIVHTLGLFTPGAPAEVRFELAAAGAAGSGGAAAETKDVETVYVESGGGSSTGR